MYCIRINTSLWVDVPSCSTTKTQKKFTPELIDDEPQVVGHFLPEFVTGITHDSRKTRL